MRAAIGAVRAAAWRPYIVLHQRHPLDTLVSAHRSFGWTHPAAPRASTAQRIAHVARQSAERNLTADEYVVQHADELQRKYEPYFELLRSPPPGVRIFRSRYEEMVTFFPRWLEALLGALADTYPARTREIMRAQLVARHSGAFAPDGKHKHSVLPGRFVGALRPDTIDAVLRRHGRWIAELGYI